MLRAENAAAGKSNEGPRRGVELSESGVDMGEVRVRVIAGVAFGVESESLESPVRTRLPIPIADWGKVV